MEDFTSQSNNSNDEQTMAMQENPPTRKSVWSFRDKLVRLCWGTLGRLLWILFPKSRSNTLRMFGAKIGYGCTFAQTIQIAIPWNIHMGDECHIGEYVILYSLGPITLGDRVRIDTRAHICAGSHDMRDTRFPLSKPPISIGSDCFIGVDAYIGPNVSLANKICVHPRASVYKTFRECDIQLIGNPASVMVGLQAYE